MALSIASGTSSSNVFWCGHDAVSKTTYAIGNVSVRGVFFYFLFFLIIQREEHKAILYLRKNAAPTMLVAFQHASTSAFPTQALWQGPGRQKQYSNL